MWRRLPLVKLLTMIGFFALLADSVSGEHDAPIVPSGRLLETGPVHTTTDTLLVASSYRLELGDVRRSDGVVDIIFVVRNRSQQPVTLLRVITSCMCTEATLQFEDGETLGPFGMRVLGSSARTMRVVAPGEPFLVRVLWNPQVHTRFKPGEVIREVRIESDRSALIRFLIRANVIS